MVEFTIKLLKQELLHNANPERASISLRFFKTGKGQYGEGDKFLGVSVPDQRKIAKKYIDLSFANLEKLLNSKIHEERLTALFILVLKYSSIKERSSQLAVSNNKHNTQSVETQKKEIFDFYLSNIKAVNNWDLVDSSAPYIVGTFLLNRDKDIIYKLAKSKMLWERRIAIISTLAFININKESKETFEIADILLSDREDLIQKAVGWMLREVGKRISEKELKEFLSTRYKKMGRTALRYTIERFENEERIKYLKGII